MMATSRVASKVVSLHERLARQARFVVFEGLDGAGTTTQLRLLQQWLGEAGTGVDATKEPSNGPIGSVIRWVIDGHFAIDARTLALAFAADRAEHVHNPRNGVLASLANGRWVLCDRYLVSSLAYQSRFDIDLEWLIAINKFAPSPDVTIFVDTPPEVCLQRIVNRSSHFDVYHNEAELRTVFRNYRRVVSQTDVLGHLIVVDGNREKRQVFEDIVSQLSKWIIGLSPDNERSNIARPEPSYSSADTRS